jgi:hypothetical protein
MRYALALLAALALADPASARGNFPPRPGSGGSPKGAPPAVPEPAAIAAFGVGAAVIGYVLYRRRK